MRRGFVLRKLLLGGLIVLFLAGCQGGETPSPTPSLTAVAMRATATASPAPATPTATDAAATPTATEAVATRPTSTATPSPSPTPTGRAPRETPQPTDTPAATATPLPPPIFGVEMKWPADSSRRELAKQAGIYWVRFGAFAWDKIEPVRMEPPVYHWETVDEESLLKVAADGLQVVAIVRFAPDWAQGVTGSSCGPIRAEALDAYAQFLGALVQRYSAPPFSVRYWELGNEPDVDPSLVAHRSVFGCWGNRGDEYYGGGGYAEMLKKAYPAIKAANAEAQVVLGGLLLGCDPTHPPSGDDCRSSRFLEGILQNGGGPFFDIVSFHGYATYSVVTGLASDEHFRSWEARGGVVLGKVRFLREVLSAYGVDKPILHSEGALLCPPSWKKSCSPPGPAFYEAQADYVVWLYVRNWAEGLLGTIWYTFDGPGWQDSGLLDAGQQPKPAYRALRWLSQELSGAAYRQPVSGLAELRGYEFATPAGRVWVLWAPDLVPRLVPLPEGVVRVVDKYGQEVVPTDGQVSVSSPVYVELQP